MKAAAVLALLVCSGPVLAHETATGWSYDPSCCSTRDCSPVPPGTRVRHVAGGWNVTLPDAAEPLFFPDSLTKRSGDWDYHICISPTTGTKFCIYVPAGV